MAFGKLAVLFTVLLVCQASFVKKSKVRDAGDIDAEYASIAKALGKAVNLVTNVLDGIVGLANNFVNYGNGDNLDNVQKQTVDATRTVLGLVKSLIAIDLINMEADADEDSIIVADCLLTNGDQYVEVITSFWDTFTKCHNPSLANVTTQISTVLDDVSDMLEDIQKTDTQLDDCKDLTCITSVFVQILDNITGFLDSDRDNLNGIGGAIVSWALSFPTCVQSTAADWQKSAQQEVEKFAKCVRA